MLNKQSATSNGSQSVQQSSADGSQILAPAITLPKRATNNGGTRRFWCACGEWMINSISLGMRPQDPHTGERRGFADGSSLFEFLTVQTGNTPMNEHVEPLGTHHLVMYDPDVGQAH